MNEETWTELKKIDTLCDRLDLSYEEAHRALRRSNGDVIQALADCEREKTLEDGMMGKIWNGTKNRFNKLWQTQVKLKHNDRTVFTISAPLGLALGYMVWRRPVLRVLGLAGTAMAAVRNYELELEPMLSDPPIMNDDESEASFH